MQRFSKGDNMSINHPSSHPSSHPSKPPRLEIGKSVYAKIHEEEKRKQLYIYIYKHSIII